MQTALIFVQESEDYQILACKYARNDIAFKYYLYRNTLTKTHLCFFKIIPFLYRYK